MQAQNSVLKRVVQFVAAAAAAAFAGSAFAVITLPNGDTEHNGDFNLSPFAYGATGSAYLSALLYIKELGGALQPKDRVAGVPTLSYSYSSPPAGLGSSAVDITYTITNTTGSFTDLRFLIYLDPNGNNVSFTDLVNPVWPAKSAGDPDKRQIGADAFNNPLKPAMLANGTVIDGNNACGSSACDADFGFEWDRAALAPGASWVIRFRMVDDPALVAGGRYLTATSSDGSAVLFAGSPTLVPEPESYAMLVAGMALLAFLRMRRA